MQRRGLILADNGTLTMIQGTTDDRGDNDVLNPAFHSLMAGDFEVVALGWQPGARRRAAPAHRGPFPFGSA